MTRDETPVPAAPTPLTHAQAAAIWGANALIVDDLTAPPLTIAQSGGMGQAYPGDPNDELTAVRDTRRFVSAILWPDDPSLPGEVA